MDALEEYFNPPKCKNTWCGYHYATAEEMDAAPQPPPPCGRELFFAFHTVCHTRLDDRGACMTCGRYVPRNEIKGCRLFEPIPR